MSSRSGPPQDSWQGAANRVRPQQDHGSAVMEAEVKLLEHALRPWEVLREQDLQRRIHAERWHEGTFDAVLRIAVERGVVEALPEGFVALPRRDS